MYAIQYKQMIVASYNLNDLLNTNQLDSWIITYQYPLDCKLYLCRLVGLTSLQSKFTDCELPVQCNHNSTIAILYQMYSE